MHEVGKRLSKARLYLQHPLVVDENIEYDNPHLFKVPNQSALLSERSEVRSVGIETTTASCIDISQLFDEACGGRGLQSPSLDPRIKATLLRYSYSKFVSTEYADVCLGINAKE